MESSGAFDSPAVALARRVLPQPGGPTSRAPLGILAPSLVYLVRVGARVRAGARARARVRAMARVRARVRVRARARARVRAVARG